MFLAFAFSTIMVCDLDNGSHDIPCPRHWLLLLLCLIGSNC